MTDIIDFKVKRGEREKARPKRKQKKSFSEIERDLGDEAFALYMRGDKLCCGNEPEDIEEAVNEYCNWFHKLSKKQRAKLLLDQAAKVQDLAKRLMEAAIREEREQAS